LVFGPLLIIKKVSNPKI